MKESGLLAMCSQKSCSHSNVRPKARMTSNMEHIRYLEQYSLRISMVEFRLVLIRLLVRFLKHLDDNVPLLTRYGLDHVALVMGEVEEAGRATFGELLDLGQAI